MVQDIKEKYAPKKPECLQRATQFNETNQVGVCLALPRLLQMPHLECMHAPCTLTRLYASSTCNDFQVAAVHSLLQPSSFLLPQRRHTRVLGEIFTAEPRHVWAKGGPST